MTLRRSLAAVVPAAGFSSRMGQFKPLLPLNRGTIIGHAIAGLKHIAGLDIIVVVGHRKAELIAALRHEPVRIIENPDYRKGMFSSITAGVAHIDPSAAAFFVLPADIALVRPATLIRLAAACHDHPGHIIYPVFAQRRGHPPIVPTDLAPALEKWQAPGGLKAFLGHHCRAAIEVPVADCRIHQDMDTYEDYLRAVADWKRRDVPTTAECEEILTAIHPVSSPTLRHSRQVARTAGSIARALTQAGIQIDPDIARAGALLHDLAKGSKDHALAGEKLIRDLGFPRIAPIVGAHTDLDFNESSAITETEVVHLADKLVKEDRVVPLEEKFEHPLRRWADDPAALAHVLRRRKVAFKLKAKVEFISGRPLEEIVAENQV